MNAAINRHFWWVHSTLGVNHNTIGQILDHIQVNTPGADVAIKAFNGTLWQGQAERYPREGISIMDAEGLQAWVEACHFRGIQCHAWGVITNTSVRQSDIVYQVAAVPGIGSVILDVEPYRHYFYDDDTNTSYTYRDTLSLCNRLADIPIEKLALCYDYRRPKAIHFDLWRKIVTDFMPMVYTGSFEAPPQEVVPLVHKHMKEYELETCTIPALQTYIEPEDYDPLTIHTVAALMREQNPEMLFSFFRYTDRDDHAMQAVRVFMEAFPTQEWTDPRAPRYYSLTQVNSASSCQRRWQYTYIDEIQRATVEEGPRTTGQLVHEGLSAALNVMARHGWDDETGVKFAMRVMSEWMQVSAENVEFIDADGNSTNLGDNMDRMIEDAGDIVARALGALEIGRKYEVVNIPGTDTPFLEQQVEFSPPGKHYVVRGIVDAVLRDITDGSVALVDWKIRSKFQSHDSEAMIPQLAVYQYMVRQLYDINTHLGIVFNVKSVPPRSPMYNKNGTPNKNYLKYEWVRPVLLYRSPEIQNRMWDNFMEQVEYVEDLRSIVQDGENLPMMLGWQCGHCEFRNICHAEIFGQDIQYVIDNMYMPRRKRGMNEAQGQTG